MMVLYGPLLLKMSIFGIRTLDMGNKLKTEFGRLGQKYSMTFYEIYFALRQQSLTEEILKNAGETTDSRKLRSEVRSL